MNLPQYQTTGFDDNFLINSYSYAAESESTVDYLMNKTPLEGFFRPVLGLTFVLDYSMDQDNPEIYHISNIVYHLIAIILVYILLTLLGSDIWIRLILTLLWSVHPLLTQAIAWIPGRNDSLLTITVLGMLICFIQYIRHEHIFIKYLALVAHAILFMLGLLCKESSIIAILLVAGYYFLWEDRKWNKSLRPFIIVWIAAISVYIYLRSNVDLYTHGGDSYGLSVLLGNLPVLFCFLGKSILPIAMNACSRIETLSLLTGLLALIPISLYIKKSTEKKKIIFALAWFALSILPTLYIDVAGDPYDYLEHRAYLATVGLIFLFIPLTKEFFNKRNIIISILLLAILSFAIRTKYYQADYQNREILWTSVKEMYPQHYLGYLGMGRYFISQKEYSKARTELLRASKFREDYKIYYSLARLEIEQKNLLKAENMIEKALTLNNNKRELYTLYGEIKFRQNNLDSAEILCKKALDLDPYYSKAISNLGTIAAARGQLDKAASYWKQALETDPRNDNAKRKLEKYYKLKNQQRLN